MGQSEKLEFSATLEAGQAADYLARIADGLRRGVVVLSTGGRTLRLEPTALVAVELEGEARPEKQRGSLALEVSWKAEHVAAAPTLEITVDPREEVGRAPAGVTRD